VSGDADPATGYDVRVDGSDTVIDGTSAVAPLWAGLIARINQAKGSPCGYINPQLYENPQVLRDITQGNNGDFKASAGSDACTGLGSPDGSKKWPAFYDLIADGAVPEVPSSRKGPAVLHGTVGFFCDQGNTFTGENANPETFDWQSGPAQPAKLLRRPLRAQVLRSWQLSHTESDRTSDAGQHQL
jgi:hypothetical protein